MSSETRDPSSSIPDRLPVAPSLELALQSARIPKPAMAADLRVLTLSAWSILLGLAGSFVAFWFVRLINLLTNVFFYGRWSIGSVSPAGHSLGAFVMGIPVIGGLIVGLMARYGTKAIRGHGIPEAMEQILTNQSRISPKVLLMKPLSAAVAIGTGGPFGAEGPIIATGGALGSLLGQMLHINAVERKTLLAAGAAAGMTAIFGSPVSAVLLSLELLLFELHPRSLIPVAMAAVAAMGSRIVLFGPGPVFSMSDISSPGGGAIALYVAVGAMIGLASVGITRLVYAIEDGFERLPIHWMWWPTIGAVAVGVIGFFAPATLGVGYENIDRILSGELAVRAIFILMALKLASWAVSLGSGTSGGTLAPLFTIGGALGALLGRAAATAWPGLGVDPRVAALVGMAAIFSGASRAFLTSVVFAFETTRQPLGLLPLLGGGAAAYLTSWILMRHTIMTERMSRRGIRVPSELVPDFLDQVYVRDVVSGNVVALDASDTVAEVREWLSSRKPETLHQGFPILDENERLVALLTRRDLLDPTVAVAQPVNGLVKRPPVIIFEDNTLREARDHMLQERVGRLIVVSRSEPHRVIAMLSRRDILSAHRRQLDEARALRTMDLRIIRFLRK